MNPSQARLINPILSTHALGYVRPGNIGRFLFPTAYVGQYGGQVIQFGKEGFRRYNSKRAPGSATKRVTYGYLGVPYTIVPNALEALVPDEIGRDASVVPGVDLAEGAVTTTMDALELDHEHDCATIARNASNYDSDHKVALTGTARWTGSAGDPTANIDTAKEAIRTSVGLRANTVALSATAYAAAKNNAKILERFKYTSSQSVTLAMLAALWDVQQVVVGDAISASGATDAFSDVWGHDVIVAYVAPPTGGTRRDAARPSYGYTYTITGMPTVNNPYRDENAKSWVYGVTADRTPVLSGMLAGYLIQNAGAAAA